MFRVTRAKLVDLYNPYVLAILTVGYVLGELGHYLIGVTSKRTAIDLRFGDRSCQQNYTDIHRHSLPKRCEEVEDEKECTFMSINGTKYCEWNYNGRGIEYQILAGPSFIAIFTIMGIVLGVIADKMNRVKVLTTCTLIFGIAIFLQGSVKNYWEMLILRMILAAGEAGCNPLATGILSDIFPENKRALVMAIFNWGIYAGYGITFPIGRYITEMNILDLGWRICYYGTGITTVIVAILTASTLVEPDRKIIGEESNSDPDAKSITLWGVLKQPRMILLIIATSFRQCGGMTFAYNADLYYNHYFPNVDLGWYLFGITIVIGSVGVVVGAIVSDKIVAKMGIRSRVAVLAISQFLSSPFAYGSVNFEPMWAMVSLGISFFFAEMWFGILFAILVEIVPLRVRSTVIGIFLFVMNNIGGNLPIVVEPISKFIGYRESISIFYSGFYLISSILFFVTMFWMDSKPNNNKDVVFELLTTRTEWNQR